MKQPTGRCACGRRGRRHCPALEGAICTRCCGAKRGSELACPPECPHFPFGVAAYDLWLNVDGAWMRKAADRVAESMDAAALQRMIGENDLSDADDEGEAFSSSFGLAVYQALFFLRDAEGESLADQWEAEGWRGLNNDERVMMRYRRHSFATVLEVQRVLSDQALECVDLLERERGAFVLFDRSTAARAVRFDRLLVWVCHYPHFSRIGPAGVLVPHDLANDLIAEVELRASEAAAGPRPPSAKEYLAHHFVECCHLVAELSEARFQQMIRSVDVRHCVSTYDLAGERAEVEAVLQGKPDFEVDDREPEADEPQGTAYYSWLRLGESKELEKEMPAAFRHGEDEEAVGGLANVKLLPDRLIVETFSLQKHRFAKKMVEKYLGELVAFRDETIVDLAKQAAERRKDPHWRGREPEGERVPREVEQHVLATVMRGHYRKFLEESVPALDGMTPREAAQDPAMRPRLVELMKSHLHSLDQQSRSNGVNLRIDWVIDELGLTELQP